MQGDTLLLAGGAMFLSSCLGQAYLKEQELVLHLSQL